MEALSHRYDRLLTQSPVSPHESLEACDQIPIFLLCHRSTCVRKREEKRREKRRKITAQSHISTSWLLRVREGGKSGGGGGKRKERFILKHRMLNMDACISRQQSFKCLCCSSSMLSTKEKTVKRGPFLKKLTLTSSDHICHHANINPLSVYKQALPMVIKLKTDSQNYII